MELTKLQAAAGVYRSVEMSTIVDGFELLKSKGTRECLAITVERKLNATYVLETLGELFIRRGPPQHIRSDHGPEFCAQAVKRWLQRLAVKTLFIEPGSPWENGYIESL